MCRNACFPKTQIQRDIEVIEKMKDNNFTIIDDYIKNVKLRYKAYHTRQYIKGFLRFILMAGGFAITTMTTYNNPYFAGDSDFVNVVVWYFSISNNIVNIILEKINGYNLEDDKSKIKLLIKEGKLYNNNAEEYSFYPIDDHNNTHTTNKMQYFKDVCNEIINSSTYDFLTKHFDDPKHIKDINKSKVRRYERLWRDFTPPDQENNDANNNEPSN